MAIFLSNCSTSKHLANEQYLLSKNNIVEDGHKLKNKELFALLKQKPNKKILGFIPMYLNIYNFAAEKDEDHYFKRIGEPPVLINYRLARKSATQIELYYKNKGYFDASVSFEIHKKKHKAKAIYSINIGASYKINEVKINHKDDSDLTKSIKDLLVETKIKKGKTYNFRNLEDERSRIASKLQNQGYYQFNKEFIYFLADTNQTTKEINLDLVVKSIEKINDGSKIQSDHRQGVIGRVNVHLENIYSTGIQDTVTIKGINFIFNKGKPPFNLNRLANKIFIRPGISYNKSVFDKSYEALSELKNFKKISFEFSQIDSDSNKDILVSDIFLTSGNKIAYSVELEATTNPELKEGISGSASLSHYNILNGAEHLELTFKGSNNFRNIKENGAVINFTIPSLISPIKLNQILNKTSKTKTIFTASVIEMKRPEFTRNSISGSYSYQWNTRQKFQHKLSLFNLSYVNFEGDASNLNNISEYLIAKDYSSHLIPTSSYTFSYENKNKLKKSSFYRFHIESSGSLLRSLARPLNFNQLKNKEGEPILQENGNPTYTMNIWNSENIFTQYIKTSLDYRYYWEINQKNSIAVRSMTGLIYAFGNTNQSPFHKKFIAGGANDLRGWQAFKKPAGSLQNNTDTLFTGGIKLITSLEYRFSLVKKLNGSVFIDAGNIWEISSNNNQYKEANFKWNQFIDEIAVDIGIGLRYDFKYFILRTDLGFIVRDPSESDKWKWRELNFSNSQFNIGLGYPF
tara:strand:- start:874 stop:3108 length:2235 start_codon:yes stop_codon:yes gene_type:complete